MKYDTFMDYTWEHDDTVHQLDPLTLVPEEPQSETLIPLYQLLGMTKEAALEVSTAWRLLQLRKERDRLISETDWWVLPDRTPTEAQLAYRQALRDITENFDPEVEVVFPVKP